jgi:putative transposase
LGLWFVFVGASLARHLALFLGWRRVLGSTTYLRKPNRLGRDDYIGQRAYFLTICASGRAKKFYNPAIVILLLDILRRTCATHFFEVYAYCFMPDHLHLILVGTGDSSNLSKVIQAFKGKTAAAARKTGIKELWQKGFYDHVLRDGESLDSAANYVLMNPVRAGFVRQAEEWAGSGSFVLEWKRVAVASESLVPIWR